MQKPTPWITLVVLLLGIFVIRESDHPQLRNLDLRFLDWLETNTTPTESPTPELVIIEINDSSLSLQPDWPWPALDYTLLLKAIVAERPATTAILPTLSWQNEQATYLKMLESYAHRTPRLVTAITLQPSLGNAPHANAVNLPVLTHFRGLFSSPYNFTGVESQALSAISEASIQAVTNLPIPESHPIRSLPLAYQFKGEPVASITLQTSALWLHLPAHEIQLDVSGAIHLGDQRSIPTDNNGEMLIDYRQLQSIPRFSYHDVLLAVEQRAGNLPIVMPLESLRDKVVLFGRTDKEVRTLPLPGGRTAAPIEVMAAAIATIQTKSFITPASLWIKIGIVASLLFLCQGVVRWERKSNIFILPAIASFYLLASMQIFAHQKIWMPLALPAILLGTLLLISLFRKNSPSLKS